MNSPSHIIKLVRHAPKNNNPDAHGTGIEALLAPSGIRSAIQFSAKELSLLPDSGPVSVETTVINRSIVTGKIFQSVFCLDPMLTDRLRNQRENEFIGSSTRAHDGSVVNLCPIEMSKIWAEAKKRDEYSKLRQGEDRPLYAWCQVGFDKTFGESGISIREIAARIGHFLYGRVQELEKLESDSYHLAVGHSGDIEPFLYLTLAMQNNSEACEVPTILELFERTGGALNPLTGLTFHYKRGGELWMTHPLEGGDNRQVLIGSEILEKQSRWLKQNGIADRVLDSKTSPPLSSKTTHKV